MNKATQVLPPVDEDRVLSRVGGAMDEAVPAKGFAALEIRPARVTQPVSGGQRPRLWVRPSVG